MGDEVVAVLLVQMNQDFRVALSPQSMSRGTEGIGQLAVVVDLSIADDQDGPVFVRKWLMAARQVENRQPAHAERHGIVVVLALVVGAAVRRDGRHAPERRRRRLSSGSKRGYSIDSAHVDL